jgi:hypothetical protein
MGQLRGVFGPFESKREAECFARQWGNDSDCDDDAVFFVDRLVAPVPEHG